MNGQAALAFDARSWAEKRSDEYRASLADRARDTGQQRAMAADRDGYDEALDLICQFASSGVVFDADDIRPRLMRGTPRILGSAFRRAAELGIIAPAGYGTARATTRHGAIVRRWRGRAP